MKHYICQECEDEGDLPDNSPVCFCGICAGDTGRDVRLRFTHNKAVEFDGAWLCDCGIKHLKPYPGLKCQCGAVYSPRNSL